MLCRWVPAGVADVEVAVRGDPQEARSEQLLDVHVDAVIFQEFPQHRTLLDASNDTLTFCSGKGTAITVLF